MLALSSFAVPAPVIAHLPLSGEQQAALSTAALVRILDNHKTIAQAGGADLRIALLARLVAQVIEHKFSDVLMFRSSTLHILKV